MIILGFDCDDGVNITGTSLKGYVEATYVDLVEKFGYPPINNGDKTNAEWWLDFRVEDGEGDFEYVTAAIYDWKEPAIPGGKHRWHIGGRDWKAVECVHQIMYGELENV
jgi:hypothetical protein